MPRPEPNFVTFEIDGREVSAPEGSMLVDGAKYGDVEIPVFCYEPKLGKPVGACRMCLVEIEGIPKLQTACSTPVKDGMVVTTGSDRVQNAQNAVVEFLLVNHPLDCPVCDKGGECPLQDISFGWGAGRSRFIEPKRHFKKPLQLSPLVAIDRERCILCYRCVRFSQEVAEDYQLVFVERADHTFVGTHDSRPYVAPFSGNIIELCPVGALTSTAYRFRARPWDIEGSGSICALCPSQCNVELTVRDDNRVLRVLARDNEEVDDGWLCDKGRFGYQAFHARERLTAPMARDGGSLREVSWDRALADAAAGLRKAGAGAAALVGGEATNEEGFLVQRLMRDALGSPHVDSRPSGRLEPAHARALAIPELSARLSDVDYAGAVLVLESELVDEAPIFDLRVRKAVRRNGATLVLAGSRSGSLGPSAHAELSYAPGAAEAALRGLAAALGDGSGLDDLATRAGTTPDSLREVAGLLKDAGDVVVLWGERLSHGPRAAEAITALQALAHGLRLAGREGSGLIEVPAGTNARGLREVGCLPTLGPGLSDPPAPGLDAAGIAAASGSDVSALLLFQADPLRTHPDQRAWTRAIEEAGFVVAFSDFADDTLLEHADVIFPAEAYAEKEGTLTHPDGRLQRVRQAIGHPGEVRPGWSVLADLIAEVSDQPVELFSAPMVTAQVAEAVPFYAGLTLEEIGGRGVRWQDREAASSLPPAELPVAPGPVPPEAPEGDGLLLGTVRSLWAGREGRHSQALRFLAPHQRCEIAAEDARRLGISPGDEVEVTAGEVSVRAVAALRAAQAPGRVFLIEGTDEQNATALCADSPCRVQIRRIAGATTNGAAAEGVHAQAAAEAAVVSQ